MIRFTTLLFAFTASAASVPGEFELSSDAGAWRIVLTRTDTIVDGRRVFSAGTVDLEGFDPLTLQNDGAVVRFRWKREAGVFEFSGVTAGGKARGKFTFTPNPDYTTLLRATTRNWWEPSVAFESALTGARPRPEGERERQFRVFGITPDYLRQLSIPASQTLSTNDIIQLRSRGINSNDLQDFQNRGYRDLSVDEMVRIKNDGFRSDPQR